MKIAVILGSARENRMGERVSKWVVGVAEKLESAEIKFIDLAAYDLPFMRESVPPRYNPNRQVSDNIQRWLSDIAWADAYIFITPEYNRSFPGELKNAVDTIGHEGDKKPVAVVSYSGTPTGGLAAQQGLRTVLNQIEMMPVQAFVVIPFVQQVFNQDGTLTDQTRASGHGPDSMLGEALGQLQWYANVLTPARQTS